MERQLPPIVGPKNWSVRSGPRPRRRASFISNPDFVPGLIGFAVFAVLTFVVQLLHSASPNLGFVAAVIVLIFMFEWERRGRFSFGLVRQRARMDQLNLVKLPPHSLPKGEIEPETPYTDHEKVRSDPEAIIKQAQDAMTGGKASHVEKSATEQALINILKGNRSIAKEGDQITPS